MQRHGKEDSWIWQRDRATPHTAGKLREFVQEMQDFLRSNEWPPKSPDPNPCDYTVWSFLNAAVAKRRDKILTFEDLGSLWKSWKNLTPKPLNTLQTHVAAHISH